MRKRAGRRIAALLVAGALNAAPGLTRDAQAQAQAQENAAASAADLFDRGLNLMEERRYEEGCPLLLESWRIDPRMGALFTLAACEERWGKIASALAHYSEYLSRFENLPADQQPAQRPRDRMAKEAKDALAGRVPRLTVRVQGKLRDDLVVKRDGVAIGSPSIGTPLPVDPGAHEATIEDRSGQVLRRKTLVVSTGLAVIELDVPPASTASPAPTAPAKAVERPTMVPGQEWRRPTAIALGGLGLIGAAVGSITGITVITQKDSIESGCPNHACKSQSNKDDVDNAQSLATVSNISFAVGGAAIVGAVVLLLTEPKPTTSARTRVRFAFSDTSVQLGTSW
jgi:hypothetical protein